jgi:hypothetical protein
MLQRRQGRWAVCRNRFHRKTWSKPCRSSKGLQAVASLPAHHRGCNCTHTWFEPVQNFSAANMNDENVDAILWAYRESFAKVYESTGDEAAADFEGRLNACKSLKYRYPFRAAVKSRRWSSVYSQKLFPKSPRSSSIGRRPGTSFINPLQSAYVA